MVCGLAIYLSTERRNIVRLFKGHTQDIYKANDIVELVDFIVWVVERFHRNQLERFPNGRITIHHLLLQRLLVGSK